MSSIPLTDRLRKPAVPSKSVDEVCEICGGDGWIAFPGSLSGHQAGACLACDSTGGGHKPAPARLIGALAETKFQAARDAALCAAGDVTAIDDPVTVTASDAIRSGSLEGDGTSGTVMATSCALADAPPFTKMVLETLRALQPGEQYPGIVRTGDHTVRMKAPDAHYTITDVMWVTNQTMPVDAPTPCREDCRAALAHLAERGVAESIVAREAYGQTPARLAYRLSPRVSCANVDAMIGGSH